MAHVTISQHTTSSTPRPHILYIVEVNWANGQRYTVLRRYSEFLRLHEELGDPFSLPPKRIFPNSVVPLAWLDDELIAERKQVLQAYLLSLLSHETYKRDLSLARFLGKDEEEKGLTEPDDGDPEAKRKLLAASYYPSWAARDIPPNKIDYSKFDILFYAFVTPTGTAGIEWQDGDEDTLKELVTATRASGCATKIVISVGGWTGSHWFNEAMSTSTKRLTLIKNIMDIVDKYTLDGVDIDWEYPNAPGSGNPHGPEDAAHLLDFFKQLRNELGPSRIISAAVTQQPWLGSNGKPLTDVSELAKYMDFVNIMNYDAFGASAKPGPNAPLGDLCGTSSQPECTAHASLSQWTKAGMPSSKLLLGLPLYGYVSKSRSEKLSGSIAPAADDPFFPRGAHPRGPPKEKVLSDLSRLWGQQVAFGKLVTSGTLVKKGGDYEAGGGYTMGWDDCSDTPFLFNKAKTTVVTYDDTWSIASKAKFARVTRMGGCFTWSMDQDDGLALHNVILENIGRGQSPPVPKSSFCANQFMQLGRGRY